MEAGVGLAASKVVAVVSVEGALVGDGNVTRSSHPLFFFSKNERERIVSAIQAAEMKTSGEIRVHLENKAKDNILDHAKLIFEKLGMARTQDRNGILIWMCIHSKRFVVLGDQGIHEKLQPGFWDELVTILENHFKENHFSDGIVEAVARIGEILKTHFPYQRDDINELSDEISYS